jgi:hypothetical protein
MLDDVGWQAAGERRTRRQMRSKPLVYRAYVPCSWSRCLTSQRPSRRTAYAALTAPSHWEDTASELIDQHLRAGCAAGCANGGGWQHSANAVNIAIKECCTDVHVAAKLEGACKGGRHLRA